MHFVWSKDYSFSEEKIRVFLLRFIDIVKVSDVFVWFVLNQSNEFSPTPTNSICDMMRYVAKAQLKDWNNYFENLSLSPLSFYVYIR